MRAKGRSDDFDVVSEQQSRKEVAERERAESASEAHQMDAARCVCECKRHLPRRTKNANLDNGCIESARIWCLSARTTVTKPLNLFAMLSVGRFVSLLVSIDCCSPASTFPPRPLCHAKKSGSRRRLYRFGPTLIRTDSRYRCKVDGIICCVVH